MLAARDRPIRLLPRGRRPCDLGRHALPESCIKAPSSKVTRDARTGNRSGRTQYLRWFHCCSAGLVFPRERACTPCVTATGRTWWPMVCRCRWCRSAWGTHRSGRQRMFTRTLSEAKTMRRPCGGMSFSAGEPGLVQKEKSSDGQRHRRARRIPSDGVRLLPSSAG